MVPAYLSACATAHKGNILLELLFVCPLGLKGGYVDGM